MSQCVEVRRACTAAHPQPFLTCGFEAGIVTLTLCTQGIRPLEIKTAAVNGKSVVIGNGLIFRVAPAFLPVVPILVAAGTFAGFGLAEGAAVFLPNPPLPLVVLPSLCIASPASQTGLPAESAFKSFVLRGLRGINASPS